MFSGLMFRLFVLAFGVVALLAAMPADAKTIFTHDAVEAFVARQDYQQLPFDQKLKVLDEYLETMSPETPSDVWARAIHYRLGLLATLGDFEAAKGYLEQVEDRLIANAKNQNFYVRTLYSLGFIYIYTDHIEKAINVIEEIKRDPRYQQNDTYQQYADTLLVALNSNIGNAILAAEILIDNLEDAATKNLSPLDQLKLIVNISYALIEGKQFDRANEYVSLGRDRLAFFRAQGRLSDIEIKQVNWHLSGNYALILIHQNRLDQLGDLPQMLAKDARELGSPVLTVSATHIEAADALGKNQLDLATDKINSAIDTAKKLGNTDLLTDFYATKARILSKAGDNKGALQAYLSGKEIYDSLNSQQSRARAEYMHARLEVNRQNSQIARLEAKNLAAITIQKRDRFIVILSWLGILSLGAFAIGMLRSQKRLKAYAEELEVSEQKAHAATQAKSVFLANMSHEIRTPLNGLMGMAQILAEKDLGGDQQECVDIIVSSGESLLTIVNDVLDLSKIEAGKMTIDCVPTDIRKLFNQLIQLWRSKAEEKGIVLSVNLSQSLPPYVICDPVRIRQCVNNLISNAIKFTDKGGVVVVVDYDVKTEPTEALLVQVRDTGIGIEQEKIDRLFNAFEQMDSSTTRRFGGTGLGLAITSELIALMDGEISVDSTPGQGSEFFLRIKAPKADLQMVTAELADNAHKHNTEETPLNARRILLVDDNMVNRLVAKAFLDDTDLDIVEAANGKEALEKLASDSSFDILLLDMHMPIMDGPETVKHIRNSPEPWRNIPILTLTADAMDGDKDRYIKMGTDGYVAKPLVKAELQREINRILSARQKRRTQAA